jgi:hypothetical protein
VLVAHAYNPSYLGSRDQEGSSWSPAWTNRSQDSISQNNQSTSILEALSSFPSIKKEKTNNNNNNNQNKAGRQWLTPVILATQEAEFRRIAVWSQPRQIVETLSQKKKKADEVAQAVACLPSKYEALNSNLSVAKN